ncbi:regulatory protein GemA [Rhodobacteraceae bacterium M382]|nr:regulatory protein GemA [Rhodobacteraceae bacterium M382]
MTRALQQKIHIGCRQLGLDPAARRDLQLVETGKSSMRDMTEADLKKVIKRLESDGFKPTSKRHQKHKAAPRADLRLIHVLWAELGKAGELRDPTRAGLNRFIRARFGSHWGIELADVDVLRQWNQIDQVIQALKAWNQRTDTDFDWEQHAR